MELLERRQLLSGTVVGFEESGDISNFAYTRVLSSGQSNAPLSQADGHDGHILQLGYTHHHDGVKFSPSGEDYLLSTGTISVDARLRYYGPTNGTANGTIPALILKQPSPAANDSYMVTLDQTGGTIRLIIGAAKEIGGSREAYKYYGTSNGHSTYASIILSGYTPVLDNASHDLGWYNIAASISGGEEGSSVTITAKVTAPEGTSYYGQWQDSGPSAWTGTGTVGIAQYSQWSQAGEFDNFTVDDEVTLFTPPVVSIEAGSSTVVEGDTITYTVSRTGEDQSQALTVFLDTPTGTATPGSDYGTVPASVTIPASESSVTFGINTIGDSAYEPDETLVVRVASNASYAFDTPSAEVTIQDDDVNFTMLAVTDLATDGAVVQATDASTQSMNAFIHSEAAGDVVRIKIHASDIGTAAGTPVAYTVTSGGQTLTVGSLGAADQELVLAAVADQVFRIEASDGQTERAVELVAKERELVANPTSLTVTKPAAGEETPTVTISVQGGGAIIGTPTAEFWNEGETQQVLSKVGVTWVGTTVTLHVKPTSNAGIYRLRLFVKNVGGLEAMEDQSYKPVWVTVTINER